MITDKFTYTLLFLIFSFFTIKAQGHSVPQNENIFLNRSYWKANPSIDQIKEDIAKGNNIAELNRYAMDPTTYAILEKVDNETVKFLIQQKGNSVNKKTHDERIYAHWAAYKNNPELLNYLMEQGSDPKALDHFDYNIINFAAATGVKNTQIYDIAEQHGVDFTTPNKRGANVLHSALSQMKEDTQLLDYLLSKGLKLGEKDNEKNNAFVYAVQSGNFSLMNQLEENGLCTDNDNAIFFAARPGRRKIPSLETFKYLATKPINFNAKDKEGRGVIQYLVGNSKNIELVKFLMNKGVNIAGEDDEGNTALMNAIFGGVEMIKLLNSSKEQMNHKNKKGETAFLRATKYGKPNVLNYLIQNGAEVKTQNNYGENAYFYLIDRYNQRNKKMFTEKLALLQSLTLDAKSVNKNGENLLHKAVSKNDKELITTLLGMGVDINQADKEGNTPLHKAIQVAKDLKMAEFLLSKGARKSLKTAFGETAFDLAEENEYLIKKNIDLSILKLK